nr:hypothetical protein [Streptomyces lunaelactis]
MRVLLDLLPRRSASCPNGLHLLEGHSVDERRMPAFVPDALVPDEAGVVAIDEHLVDVLVAQRAFRELLRGWDAQSSAVEFGGELTHGPVAGGVGAEHPLDERCALRIDGDCADFASVDAFADIAVAERRMTRRAAGFGLLPHTLLGFGGQVGGVELGDARHDPVQELARGCLVDVLLGGDELCSGLADGHVDEHVVFPVTGEPVNLVHDDVADDAEFVDEAQHCLEFGTVGGLGRLSRVYELGHNDRAELFGLLLVGVALGRDGQALFVVAGFCLCLGRHAQVTDGELGVFGKRLCQIEEYAHSAVPSWVVGELR